MDRIRQLLKPRPIYEPLDDGTGETRDQETVRKQHFSWLEYTIFLLLGASMLWAWNMFLAASPYFQHRFVESPRLLSAYSPTLLSVSTISNTLTMVVLTYLQMTAHYPNRIIFSLVLNTITFGLLALSTVLFRDVSPGGYFGFLMSTVFAAALASAFCQNGTFAYVAAFNMPKYTQGIMMGQAIAGVLPCIAQIITVLAFPPEPKQVSEVDKDGLPQPAARESGTSAFVYFLTAVPISLVALLAFGILQRRYPETGITAPAPSSLLSKPDPLEPPPPSYHPLPPTTTQDVDSSPALPPTRKAVSLWHLYKKLHWLANAVFLTFALTMFYPVFTQSIHSSYQPSTSSSSIPASPTSADTAYSTPRLLQPSSFIPLAFLLWNTGDLLGRTATLHPFIARLTHHPRLVFLASLVRVVWIPLYESCRREAIRSDFFYLVVVQGGFGVGNGIVGSLCMMGAGEWVDDEGEREAAGGFMGLMLVAGLSVGSAASFAAA